MFLVARNIMKICSSANVKESSTEGRPGRGQSRTHADETSSELPGRKPVSTPEGVLVSVEHSVPDASKRVTFTETQEAGGVVSLLIKCLGAFNLPADQNHREAAALWNCSGRKLRQQIFNGCRRRAGDHMKHCLMVKPSCEESVGETSQNKEELKALHLFWNSFI